MSYLVSKFNDKPGYSNKADGTRVYNVKYIVESSTPNDLNIHAARKAVGMPAPAAKYEFDPGVFNAAITLDDIKFASNRTLFYFNVEYAPQELSTQTDTSEDPLKQKPKVSYGTVKYQVPFDLAYAEGDTQGNPSAPVVNTAFQKFDPPPVKLKINRLVTIQYNVRIFREEWTDDFIDTVNESKISILGANSAIGCARINDLNASNAFDSNGREYFQVTVVIEKSKEPFKPKFLSQGFMALSSEGILDNIYIFTDPDAGTGLKSVIQCKSDFANVKQLIVDGLLEPVQEPHKLDEDGKLLFSGDPVYVEYQQNWLADWSPLLIPKTKPGSIRI